MASIEHVVVLMLENRSFDAMLGRLYGEDVDFRGVPPNAQNTWAGKSYPVWTSPIPLSTDSACIPTPDPNEDFVAMTAQIFGEGNTEQSPATMSGFAANYATTKTHRPGDIMHGFSPEQLPVLSSLARSFGVCDDWHASAPNQTWPNRFFLHTGTANGYVNNKPLHLPYMMETVFNRLADGNKSWGIYHHDMPQSATLTRIWLDLPTHLHDFDDFLTDAQAGNLPNYSFIEPQYFTDPLTGTMPNDQHPPHDVRYGERLIARTYDALRSGPGWKKTLFVILYDENGGLYDHVPPGAAKSPGPPYERNGFKFDRYGVRVPAVLVSPWIKPGSIIRRPKESGPPYDHTSVIKTLGKLFEVEVDSLSKRVKAAPDFLGALSLTEPTNDGPFHIPLPSIATSSEELKAAEQAPPNAHQQAMANLAAHLPAGIKGKDAQSLGDDIGVVTEVAYNSVAEAAEAVKDGLSRFLG